MCCFASLLHAVDSSLARLDYTSLSQQALMEMLIEGIENRKYFCEDSDEPKDIEGWQGVQINGHEVKEIDWSDCSLGGSLNFEWLPGLNVVDISGNLLTGSLYLTSLPNHLTAIRANINRFSGHIDLTHLPATLTMLDLSFNGFSGSPDLTKLPCAISTVDLADNVFSGSLDLSCLPIRMESLDLSGNLDLSGEVFIPKCVIDRVSVVETDLIKRVAD